MEVTVESQVDPACDEFVRRMPGAKLCHVSAWGPMVRRATGHEPLYLAARDGGQVRGVLPMTHVRSRLFGNRLVSQAFSSYGGPLADGREALDALFARAVEIATERGAETIDLRADEPLPLGLTERDDKVSMRLPLVADPEELWKSFTSQSKVRNHVRKARKAGIVTAGGGPELLDEFYGVYTVRMRQLGTPCYSRKLFAAMMETFPDNTRIFVGRLDGRVVGARLVNWFNDLIESVWGVTRTEYNRHSPNHLLYWAVFEHFCPLGAKWFDFGPSTVGGSSHKFKKQWGSKQIPLRYQFWVRPGKQLNVLSPNNPKYKRKVEMWKKLPLWLTRLLGPILSRNLP